MPPIIDGNAHSNILMWVTAFFFTGMGLYGAFFWYFTKGLRSAVKDMGTDLCSIRDELDKIDKRKVELIVYLDDKEKTETILKTLQTTDRCMLMQRACIGSITPILTDMKEDLKTVLENQQEFAGIKGVLDLVSQRQKEVIERIDSHVDGHSHDR